MGLFSFFKKPPIYEIGDLEEGIVTIYVYLERFKHAKYKQQREFFQTLIDLNVHYKLDLIVYRPQSWEYIYEDFVNVLKFLTGKYTACKVKWMKFGKCIIYSNLEIRENK